MSMRGMSKIPKTSDIHQSTLTSFQITMCWISYAITCMMVGGNQRLEIEALMDMELETHHHEVAWPGHIVA